VSLNRLTPVSNWSEPLKWNKLRPSAIKKEERKIVNFSPKSVTLCYTKYVQRRTCSEDRDAEYSPPYFVALQPYFLIACVTSEKERGDETEEMSFPQPSQAHLPGVNDSKLKDVTNCKPVFIPRNKVCWVAIPCDWVIASRRFEETYRFHFQGPVCELTHNPKEEGGPSFRNVGKQLSNHTTQGPEQQFLNRHAVEQTANQCFHVVRNIFVSNYCFCLIY
jgi:hypothetical protein